MDKDMPPHLLYPIPLLPYLSGDMWVGHAGVGGWGDGGLHSSNSWLLPLARNLSNTKHALTG